MAGDTFAAFLAWMRQHGFSWSEEDVSFRVDGGRYAVLARRTLPEAHVVCTMPKEAMLTVRTTAIADLLREQGVRTRTPYCTARCLQRSLTRTCAHVCPPAARQRGRHWPCGSADV